MIKTQRHIIKLNKSRKGQKFSESHRKHYRESILKNFKEDNNYKYKISKNFGKCKGKDNGMFGKKQSKLSREKMRIKAKERIISKSQLNKMRYALMHNKVKHHLDLNRENNKDSNIYKLLNGRHQQFHRLAYHYLLEKYGIKEILKYKKWFEKNIIKEK